MMSSSLFDRIVAIRRDLHQHPELSWQEHRTAERVCSFLDELGISYRSGVAETGVIADLGPQDAGPRVALRADLDALPIHEETGLTFCSSIDGVMHACGHDGHTAMLLGAAALLNEEELQTPVRLIFQPAEETGFGARRMVELGALEGVGMIFGGHVDRHYPAGAICVTHGAVNASSDRFEIEIRGQGGHAARPHEAVDAVVVGSLLVISIQTIVSREVNPAHPSVVTVGRFDAGTASNVIAGNAKLQGTIRAQETSVRQHLKDSIRRITTAIGRLHDADISIHISDGTPAVINEDAAVDISRRAAARSAGTENVVQMLHANMGGEDFGFFLDHVPGCYVRFGAQIPGKEGYPAHSSRFDIDERALAVGAEYFHAVALEAGTALRQSSDSPSGSRATC